jgi:hypothetical protein
VERWRLLDANTPNIATVEDPNTDRSVDDARIASPHSRKLADEGHSIPEGTDYQPAGPK